MRSPVFETGLVAWKATMLTMVRSRFEGGDCLSTLRAQAQSAKQPNFFRQITYKTKFDPPHMCVSIPSAHVFLVLTFLHGV